MSDSDEFGGLAPTTPVPSVAKPRGATARRGAKPNSQAGSSRPNLRGGRKKAPVAQTTDSDAQEIEPVENELAEKDADDVVQIDPSPPPKETRASSMGVNGRTATKSKAKVKVQPRPTKKSKPKPASEEDEIEEVMVDVDVEDIAEDIASTINNAMKGNRTGAGRSKSDAEKSRVFEQLKRAQAQIEKLTTQLEEALQIRETEAEALRQQQEAQYLEQLRVQESLISDLTARLERVQPLVGSGKGSILHLITREAAEQEQQNLEMEKEHWKKLAKDADKQLAVKEKEIEDRDQTIKELQFELDIEKKRNQELANKPGRQPPGSATRAQPKSLFGADEPKHVQVIKFYEDLTNLIVPSIKTSKSKYLGLDEWTFTCVYTILPSENAEGKSLNFTLRFCYEPASDTSEPVISEDQLVPTVKYVPLSLEQEPPEFVESISFLNAPFTFQQDQVSIFLETLKTNVGSTDADAEDNASNASSVQLIE